MKPVHVLLKLDGETMGRMLRGRTALGLCSAVLEAIGASQMCEAKIVEHAERPRKLGADIMVSVRLGDVIASGKWREFCNRTSLDPCCINEGQATEDDEYDISLFDLNDLGLRIKVKV